MNFTFIFLLLLSVPTGMCKITRGSHFISVSTVQEHRTVRHCIDWDYS